MGWEHFVCNPIWGLGACVKPRQGLEMSPHKIWGRGIGLIAERHIGRVETNFDTKE